MGAALEFLHRHYSESIIQVCRVIQICNDALNVSLGYFHICLKKPHYSHEPCGFGITVQKNSLWMHGELPLSRSLYFALSCAGIAT